MFYVGTFCLFKLDANMLFMNFDCMSERNILASTTLFVFYFCYVFFQRCKDSIFEVKWDMIVLHFNAAVFCR